MINAIIIFFNHPFFIVVGGATVTIAIFGILYKVVCMVFGITPIVFRLGIALWRRRVAIFGSLSAYESLKASLVDSKVFKEKNILHITNDNLDKAKNETIFLIDWESYNKEIKNVFSLRKNHQTPIVIFAKPASIPQKAMFDIANRANTVVVNFRGRLLNDILTSLITTTYDS